MLRTAARGGSTSARARLWKRALQPCAEESDVRVRVSHLPPGTRQWQKIAHRLCCSRTATWRGQPRKSREVVVSLMGATTTAPGLPIQAALDAGPYPPGVNVSEAEMTSRQIARADFQGDWHYTRLPHRHPRSKRRMRP